MTTNNSIAVLEEAVRTSKAFIRKHGVPTYPAAAIAQMKADVLRNEAELVKLKAHEVKR